MKAWDDLVQTWKRRADPAPFTIPQLLLQAFFILLALAAIGLAVSDKRYTDILVIVGLVVVGALYTCGR